MTEREYQRALVAALNAELGARGWTRKHLGEAAGITEQTMMRVFRLERDMNVQQLGAMADALGVTVDHLAAEADRWSRSLPQSDRPALRPTDARQLVQWLLDHPGEDDELQSRLGDIAEKTGLSGNALARLRDEVVTLRRRELERSLRALTPSDKRAHDSA